MTPALPRTVPASLAVSDVLAALSAALDLTEGQPPGHALRVCGIAMGIADRLSLPPDECVTLYHASLLKDAGCSSNAARVFQLFGGDDHAAKRDLKRVDWSSYLHAARYAIAHAAPGAGWPERARRIVAIARAGPAAADRLVELRCERGASIAAQLGFAPEVSLAIACLDEHWDGAGRPARLAGDAIPVAARILLLAQTLDVFTWLEGAEAALAVARRRSGRWFDPGMVRACAGSAGSLRAWRELPLEMLRHSIHRLDPAPERRLSSEGALERVAEAFASIVDAKSPFTERHSRRVARIAMIVAAELGVACEPFRVAALLHDLGKLAVPNSILDKPGPLSAEEWIVVRRHPADSYAILQQLPGLGDWAMVAAAHHERLDGRGYHLGLDAPALPLEARILAVADVYESLTAERPYRTPLAPANAIAILEQMRGAALDGSCIDALARALDRVHGEDEEAGEDARAA